MTHDPADANRAALRATLLDYSQSPGKYQVALRQPQLLFAALREVLQIAVGREPEGTIADKQESTSLRDAARFFVRTALLYPGADHYALLGLDRSAEGADLKDRYRLMMRLLHPDFSGPAAGAWPADAAVRVNRAYDTLSSAVQRREYDERLAQVAGAGAAYSPEPRRVRPLPQAAEGDMRQSRFKQLAALSALAGVAVLVLSFFATGSPERVHLVQRTQLQPEPVQAEIKAPVALRPPAPARTPELQPAPQPEVATAPVGLTEPQMALTARPAVAPSGMDALRVPAPALAAPRLAAATRPVVAETRLERVSAPKPVIQLTGTPQPSAPEPRPELQMVAAVAAPVTPPPAIAAPIAAVVPSVAPTPVQATAPPRPAPKPGPTLMEAQPLLSQLLQVMESGRGERILNLLDPDARSKPSAQALSRQYDMLVDGARPVRVSHVEFKAEPGDGRLLVVGYFRVLAGEQTIGSLGKKMVLRAEFASREGNVVITGLSGGAVN